MTADERAANVHRLFNELHRELEREVEDIHYARNRPSDNGLKVAVGNISSRIDALHHDYTELTL